MTLKKVSSSIRTQFLIVMLLLIVVPVIIGAVITYYYLGADIKKNQVQQLITIRDGKISEMQQFCKDQKEKIGLIAAAQQVQNFLEKAARVVVNSGVDANGLAKQFPREYAQLNRMLAVWQETPVSLVEAQSGMIVYQSMPGADFGLSFLNGKLSTSFVAGFVQTILSQRTTLLSDFKYYAPLNKKVCFMGTPVFARNGNVLGVILVNIPAENIAKILAPKTSLEQKAKILLTDATGTVLVTNEGDVSSQYRFPLKKFTQGESTFYTKDATGKKVLATVEMLHLPNADLNWRLVAQMDETVLAKPFAHLRVYLFFVVLFLISTGLLVVFWLSRLVSTPIELINNTLTEVSAGNLKVEVPQFDYGNELDGLAQNLQKMVERLHSQIYDVREHINNISSSSAEISATISQITASSSETASAITQTASSSEEVAQLARSFDEKAKDALQSSNQTIEASENSKEAINAIYQVIGHVKTQIDEVANSMVDLSKQSQTISEITTAVQEIAEQSNILAINASIEATKAGEYGRGFAVVANEVRNLAEQSKKATQQIRTILDAIQESISRSVMQVEQTNKIVNEGSVHMEKVNQAVETLSNSIDHLIHLVSEVAEASHEQIEGTAQIKEAMENIKDATSQNLDGMRQMEEVIIGLKQTAEYLKQMVSMYKL